MKYISFFFLWMVMLVLNIAVVKAQKISADDQGIKIYDQNPWYWQYQGSPIILRGGSDDDNLFQWKGNKLTDHLDLLVSVGGNYLRNTMSDRDEGNEFAFKKIDNNKYDLTQWNEEYWNRLAFFLDETSKRGIIVQVTFWDQFDLGTSQWRNHPWNPDRNINIKPGSIKSRDDFYAVVEKDNKDQLAFQQNYIDKVLSVTLQ
jgi:hypothetical protein